MKKEGYLNAGIAVHLDSTSECHITQEMKAMQIWEALNDISRPDDTGIENFIKANPIDLSCLLEFAWIVYESFKSQEATRKVILKLAKDPKQAEKKFVNECWSVWQINPSKYKDKTAFAKDMLEKCEHLTSLKIITDWCRKWEKMPPS